MPCKLCNNPVSDNICEACTKKMSGETQSADFVTEKNIRGQADVIIPESKDTSKIPIPKQGCRIDKDKAKFLWTKNEQSLEIAYIKEKLIDTTERISFEEFQLALGEITAEFNKINKDNIEPYAVLFDYKPHSSRRWVYELLKNKIEKTPQLARYFSPASEKMKDYKLLEQNFQEGLKRFVVFDDAIYSGEQILNRTIKPIAEYYKQMNHSTPTFELIVPFVTNRALELFKKTGEHYGIKINVIYKKIMPTMREIINDEEMAVIQGREGMLDIETEEPSYLGATVTYFDHRMADDHSFSAEIRKVAGNLDVPKPYADETTDYYKKEDVEFQNYKENVGL